MPNFTPKMTDQHQAIDRLSSAGVPVIERAYGFRVTLPYIEDEKNPFIECGTEHDGSISLSIPNSTTRRVEWFFRFNFTEAAQLITDSFKVLGAGYTAQEVVESMKAANQKYDHKDLEKKLQQQEVDFQEYLKQRE